MSLRLILLIAGIAVIIVIYAFSVVQRRRRRYPRMRREPRVHVSPPVERAEHDARDDADQAENVRPVAELAPPPSLRVDTRDELGELPALRRELEDEDVGAGSGGARRRRGRRRENQMELQFDTPAAAPAPAETPREPPPAAAPAAQTEPEQLLVVYLKAPEGAPFVGTDLREALELVGMRYGAMGIFHHHGVGAMESDASLFSAANMFEPGRFDLETMDGERVAGLAMFLPLPSSVEGSVAFELFLSTTQRLADRLEAKLLNASHQALSTGDIDAMRRTAAGF